MTGRVTGMVVLAVVICLGLATGCAPHTVIASTRVEGYSQMLSSLFVLSQVGSEGEVSAERFEKKLTETGAACGIRIGITTMRRLDLNPDVHLERMKLFAPEHVLMLKQAGGITGDVHWEYYDARLLELPKTMIWRADVRLNRDGTLFGDPGEILAIDLLRKLRDDRFIPPCAKIVDPEPGGPERRPHGA
jgi:hypothetical protein